MSDIENRVKRVIVEQLDVDEFEITGNAAFVEDLGADSFDLVELVMALEDEFSIKIPKKDAERLTNVQSVIDYISVHHKA